MLLWAIDNPAPANILLISGDRDFSGALHQLRLRRYNIMLGQPQRVSAPLLAAANRVWLWSSLVTGGPALLTDEHIARQQNFVPEQFHAGIKFTCTDARSDTEQHGPATVNEKSCTPASDVKLDVKEPQEGNKENTNNESDKADIHCSSSRQHFNEVRCY